MPSATGDEAVTSADCIRELCDIDARIPAALSSASAAIRSLTGASEPQEPSEDTSDPLIHFEKQTTAFYTHVQAISALLHRQAYALEEAGIISASATSDLDLQPPPPPPTAAAAAEAANKAGIAVAGRGRPGAMSLAQGPTGQNKQDTAPMQITNGGLGNLDIGWLNARRDVVGKQKEAELWAEARKSLEKLLGITRAESKDTDGHVGNGEEDGMDIDK